MSSTISELNKRVPVDSVTDVVAEFAETVVDTVQRVGSVVGDHMPESVPTAVHDAVAEGMNRGRRLLSRAPLDLWPDARTSSRTRRVILVGALLVIVGTGLVVWRRNVRRRAAPVVPDDWAISGDVREVA